MNVSTAKPYDSRVLFGAEAQTLNICLRRNKAEVHEDVHNFRHVCPLPSKSLPPFFHWSLCVRQDRAFSVDRLLDDA